MRAIRLLRPGDLGCILAALGLLAWLYAAHWVPGGPAEAALLVDGAGHEIRVALDADQRVQMDGPLGTTVIEVADGRARFASSPCSNQYCVHSGWLENPGAAAACLPNRVALRLVGRQADGGWDTIIF